MTPDPIDTGWKIHAALVDWTGKVAKSPGVVGIRGRG